MSAAWIELPVLVQLLLYCAALLALVWPLGQYIADVFSGRRTPLTALMAPVERAIYRVARIRADEAMQWRQYAFALLAFSFVSVLFLYLLLRLQGVLPLNPFGAPAVPPDLAFNIAVSFVTNTNWQSYAGEQQLSVLSQMLGLTVQNFLSPAIGLGVLMALIRGFTSRHAQSLGNLWVDLVRGILYVLLPLSLLLGLLLAMQGVPQTFETRVVAQMLEQPADKGASQELRLGPVASQVAIKQIGSNGGGYYNANGAHPFEAPTPFAGFLSMLAILLVPAALCHTFGVMVGDRRQGLALLVAMFLFLSLGAVTIGAEQAGNPSFTALGLNAAHGPEQGGGNMEGKEVRFGIVQSGLWATLTTASSNGSVNAMHDSFTPLGGMVPLLMMQFGEVVFGGVGSGLYGMLVFVLLTVFVAGLMVGRTPEYLGKKIHAFEIKMVSLVILVPPLFVLVLTAIAVTSGAGQGAILNPGAHGFTEVLYAFTSAANNNGSAFAGLSANTPFYNTLLGVAMLFGRFGVILPVLAIAGALARKNIVPPSAGTLPTHGALFIAMLAMFIFVVGALTYAPALVLGPVAAHLGLSTP